MAAAPTQYAFVRREMPNLSQLAGAGYTPLFEMDDPRLAQQIAAAQQAGMQYGIWGAPTTGDPTAFAQQLASLRQQYNPNVLVPDIEFVGKGNPGSAGYQYDQALAAALKQYLPGANVAMTVMGNQNDFNYAALNDLVSQWLPQSYGADSSKDFYDPNQIVQTLVNHGIDPSKITPVLAGGQFGKGYNGPASLFTYDDNMLNLPHAPGGPTMPTGDQPPIRTTQSSGRVPDAQNPRAVAYANMRLQQLKRAGVIKAIPQGDPTAAWRAASQGITALANQLGYTNPRDFLRAGSVKPKTGPGGRAA